MIPVFRGFGPLAGCKPKSLTSLVDLYLRLLPFKAIFGSVPIDNTPVMANYYLYILSSRHHRHLSIGVTPDLVTGIGNQRIMVSRRLHKKRVLQKLVYVETIDCVEEAAEREVKLKRAPRNQINKLVESVNPGWDSISVRALVAVGFSRS